MNESDIAVYATVDVVFPGAADDEEAMRAALRDLSRDDALFTCARINAVVSGFAPERSIHERQKAAVTMLCSPEQKMALSQYAAQHGGPERVMVFFRGQLLELARWIVTHCENRPDDGETFRDPAMCSAFLRAALIASALWQRRLFSPDVFIRAREEPRGIRRALGAIRKSVEEGNQAAHPGFTNSRGWLLFSGYLPKHLARFGEMFERATGLTLRQYFISAFAILDRTFSDQPEGRRIFATQYVEGETPFRETFSRFMQLQSQSPEEWARSLEAAPNDSGYRAVRERPIFSFPKNRSIIFDPTFYVDNLTTAPLFQVRTAGVAMNAVFGAFGLAFEDYAKDLLHRRFPSGSGVLYQQLRCGVPGSNGDGEDFEIDAVINQVTSAIVIEMKAAWIREESVLAPDPDTFLNEVRKKYGYLPESEERPKGVAQLARSIGALVRGEWYGPDREYARVTSIYPVLIVFDARLAAPVSGQFLDDEFRTLLGLIPSDHFVHRLIIMSIGDLEHVACGADSLSLESFLQAYSVADPDRVGSVHNFIATSKYLNQVRKSPMLEELAEEFMQAARAELLPGGG